MKNSGLVFIKPHAVTRNTVLFVEEYIEKTGIVIENSGKLTGGEIDKQGIVDRHYFSISNTAMKVQPAALEIQADVQSAFFGAFGTSWEAATGSGRVFNSAQYMAEFGIGSGKELSRIWTGGEFMKLGPGLYVCKVKDADIFIINGFYPGMRERFTAPEAEILWYAVAFEQAKLAWKDFRGSVIGATDPSKAGEGSIRNRLFAEYSSFGLQFRPTMSDNGVHASAGPIEGMRERMVWAGIAPEESELGRALLNKGITREELDQLLENGETVFRGKKGPVFDITEDCDTESVLNDIRLSGI